MKNISIDRVSDVLLHDQSMSIVRFLPHMVMPIVSSILSDRSIHRLIVIIIVHRECHEAAITPHSKMDAIEYKIVSIDRSEMYVWIVPNSRSYYNEQAINPMVSMLYNLPISKMMSISSSVHSVMMMIKIWVCDHLYRHDLFLSCICSHMMDSRGYILGENSSNSEIEIVMVLLDLQTMRSSMSCKCYS